MARLNEPPMSSDSIESLRRKMLRQNRDLAKSNNVRALRIRELENECACMLSENLQLRSRILELEKQVEDDESRRIADHALAIKAKLEAQLTEWGTLLAGLGLEPPIKRHSPRIKSTTKPRLSFSSNRPSPSQRRLRDVARDIEELGHIAENKAHPRMSLNPDQILALRSEADTSDSIESPDLGPPPVSQFIDEDPVKVDSPARKTPTKIHASVPVVVTKPSAVPSSPQPIVKVEEVHDVDAEVPTPAKEDNAPIKPEPKPTKSTKDEPAAAAPPSKTGSKRKLAARDGPQNTRPILANDENQPTRSATEKLSIRDKAGGKTLKELTQMRKEARERPIAPGRRPLAAKSTNNDMSSPKKATGKPVDKSETASMKADLKAPKIGNEVCKAKPIMVDVVADVLPLPTSAATSELATPVAEPPLLSPSTPGPAMLADGVRGDTPPPSNITSEGDASRPSRRNRTAVSYAEPNLRDKMRRPTKELFDAVAGEGKYSRRSSHSAPLVPEMTKVKRESDAGEVLQHIPCIIPESNATEATIVPTSTSVEEGASSDALTKTAIVERPKRQSSAAKTVKQVASTEPSTEAYGAGTVDTTGEEGETDPYEFTVSSPLPEKQESEDTKRKPGSRQSRSSRRFSSATEVDGSTATQERCSSRRRSMML